MSYPKITIIVPCRNEQSHIKATVSSMLAQEGMTEGFEIIIAEGRSDDSTREILDQMAADDSRLRIIDNPEQIVSAGLNAALRVAQGDIIIRMDTHTEYSPDYVSQCVYTLQITGADNVGGPANTKAKGYVQKTIAVAYHSPFSSGGSIFHNMKYDGPVDTVTYGCWPKTTFERYGMFDEELVRNQDDEHNLRIIRKGGKIWQSSSIQSWYYPRSSIISLFKQYMQYGYWKVRVIQKHRMPASIRHIVPGGFVGILILLSILSFFSWARLSLTIIIGLYVFANLSATLITCFQSTQWKYFPFLPAVFATFHFGYGWGFLRGVIDFFLLKKGKRNQAYCNLTR